MFFYIHFTAFTVSIYSLHVHLEKVICLNAIFSRHPTSFYCPHVSLDWARTPLFVFGRIKLQ